MSEQEKNAIENLEVEPLSDDDLESVAGGLAEDSSCSCCSKKSQCSSVEVEEEIAVQ